MNRVQAATSKNEADVRRNIAMEYLRLARRDLDAADRTAARLARLSHFYGVSQETIGDVLGIPGDKVRRLVFGD